jgi:hypothetical protein
MEYTVCFQHPFKLKIFKADIGFECTFHLLDFSLTTDRDWEVQLHESLRLPGAGLFFFLGRKVYCCGSLSNTPPRWK